MTLEAINNHSAAACPLDTALKIKKMSAILKNFMV